jgi:SAM-dependent methyltransferase
VTDDYQTVNRASWDERAGAHAASPGYHVSAFLRDPAYLSEVVRFDLPRLGDVEGLRAVHLQCHIGTDTVSLHRLGARMSGLDFSAPALAQARRLAADTGADIDFVESDVYGAPDVLDKNAFDLVYTGIGALCWLPDITRWADVVTTLLRPGGRLFVRDAHPMLATVDETRTEDDLLVVAEPYFQDADKPFVGDWDTTYVETPQVFTNTRSYSWNHSLGSIVTALLSHGMRLTMLEEHDSAPWDALPGRTVEDAHGEHRLRERPDRLAQTFTIQASKSY